MNINKIYEEFKLSCFFSNLNRYFSCDVWLLEEEK